MKNHPQLATIVDAYIEEWRPRAARELDVFRRLTDKEAITTAALAQLPSGKRHPHQYRIPSNALEESRRRLIDNVETLKRVTNFDELIELVEQLSGSIPGIGRLTVYDTSLRMAHDSVSSQHASTFTPEREMGQRRSSAGTGRTRRLTSELPTPLRKLSPREIEDALCLFKDGLELTASDCSPSSGRNRRRICPTD
jgi:hypothetical protein